MSEPLPTVVITVQANDPGDRVWRFQIPRLSKQMTVNLAMEIRSVVDRYQRYRIWSETEDGDDTDR